MAYPYTLSLKKNFKRREDGSGILIINPLGSVLRVKNISPGIRELLDTLHGTGQTEDALCDIFTAKEGSDQTAIFWYCLQRLDDNGFLCRNMILNHSSFCTLIPTSFDFKFREVALDPDKKFVLSRFAYCRNHDGRMLLESPMGHAKLELNHEGIVLLAELSTLVSISGINKRSGILDDKKIHAFFTLMLNMEALEKKPVDGHSDSPSGARENALAQWDFHDLLFHTRSRAGRHDTPLGGTFRFLEKIPP